MILFHETDLYGHLCKVWSDSKITYQVTQFDPIYLNNTTGDEPMKYGSCQIQTFVKFKVFKERENQEIIPDIGNLLV